MESMKLLHALCITEHKDTGDRQEFYFNGAYKYFLQRIMLFGFDAI
jgi:hypothetical protein